MYGFIFSLLRGVIGHADGPTSVLVSSGLNLAFMASIAVLFLLADRVLLALAAYNDARSKSNRDALMWALLIGFIGLIPGIIYLCIRNSARNYVVCQNCGSSYPAGTPVCPRCGTPNPYAPQDNPMAEHQAHQAKTYLIIGLISAVLGLVVLVTAVLRFLILVFPTF